MTNTAWSLAHAKLHTFLRKHVLLPQNSRILIAVSGGQDSLCLARLLLDIQPHWQWSLAIAHCDHRWRADSAENAAYVEKLAQQWQVPCWVEVASTPVDSEAAARTWRYSTFAQLASLQDYTHVVTGHTESDRAETVLYNLIRGSGLSGLGTLRRERPLNDRDPAVMLVRPLLAFSRQETGEFCQQQGIEPWEDSSNQSLAFRRNRIRLELLPYIKEHFNPQVERSLSQMAETVAMDIQYIEAQASRLYEQAVIERFYSDAPITSFISPSSIPQLSSPNEKVSTEEDNAHYWEISQPILQSAPLALQHRVLRRLLHKALPTPPTFQQIENLVALIHAHNKAKSAPFPGGLVAEVRKPTILLQPFS